MDSVLRRLKELYSVQDPPRLSYRRWGIVAASVVLAATCAAPVYRSLNRPLVYPEPIVGASAWILGTKFRDYAVPLAFIAVLLTALLTIEALMKRVELRIGPSEEAGLHQLLCIVSAPAGAWFTGLLTTRNDSLLLLNVSGVLVVTVLAFALILSWRSVDYWRSGPFHYLRVLEQVVLLIPAVWLAGAAVGVGVSRLLALRHAAVVLKNADVVRASSAAALAVALATAALALLTRSPQRLEQRLRQALLFAQISFPAFFLLLVPRPWMTDGRQGIGYPMTGLAWLFIGTCALAALASLIRRCILSWRTPLEAPFEIFTVMSVVAALLFLRAPAVSLPAVSSDDYHLGEILVPWRSLVRHHMVPFFDYSPARGLVNYLPGLAASCFFDGTASSFPAAFPFIYVGILLLAVPLLRRSVGLGWTALALFLAPYVNVISEIDVLVTVFLALVARGHSNWTPPRWLAVWAIAGTALVLFAPGQGGLAVIATSPLGLHMFLRGLREHRRALWRTLLIMLTLAGFAAILTPAGAMTWGAVRYALEQSSVNSVAHGIPWGLSFRSAEANPWLFEIMRASWLLVAAWAGVLILRHRSARLAEARRTVLPYAIPIFVVTTLFVFRAAGRIDPGNPSRLWIASIWGLALLLPLLLFTSSPANRRGGALFVWLLLAGIVLPYRGEIPSTYASAFEPIAVDQSVLSTRKNGGAVGLSPLGLALVEPGHVARLQSVRALLDKVLDAGETYADLTGRHAHYFYFDRRPLIETGSIYNLVREAQQLRTIESLRATPPPALLISADNILHDGGPISLRSPLVYRHALLQPGYLVAKGRGQIWLIRKDRIARIAEAGDFAVSEIDDAATNPVQQVFHLSDLKAIPASWGRSATSLEPNMRLVRDLSKSLLTANPLLARTTDGRYAASGPSTSFRLDLGDLGVAGRDAGILSFDFHCERLGARPNIEIRWATDRNPESELTALRFEAWDGRLIVPLDAAPTWLLAHRIRSMSLNVLGDPSCRTLSIQSIRLFQRHGADAVDGSST